MIRRVLLFLLFLSLPVQLLPKFVLPSREQCFLSAGLVASGGYFAYQWMKKEKDYANNTQNIVNFALNRTTHQQGYTSKSEMPGAVGKLDDDQRNLNKNQEKSTATYNKKLVLFGGLTLSFGGLLAYSVLKSGTTPVKS